MKKIRVTIHETGEDCKCTRFRCFEVTTTAERDYLIGQFNSLSTKNERDAFLSRLVTVGPVKRRRQREGSARHLPNDHSYTYCIPVKRGESSTDIKVCFKGFIAIFGITKRRVETIKKHLATTGFPPQDGRGKHNNRPHRLSTKVIQQVGCQTDSHEGECKDAASQTCSGDWQQDAVETDVKSLCRIKEEPSTAISTHDENDIDLRGAVSASSWRSCYLMDYDPVNQLLVCMMCGEQQYSYSREGARAHIEEAHPETLSLGQQQRQRLQEAWDQQVAQREQFLTSQLQQHAMPHTEKTTELEVCLEIDDPSESTHEDSPKAKKRKTF
ncbi:hypothetical protein ACEWY4_025066 [Coilia grayii]|uniref:SPIN-DOC-like zinc-finger domain-containing protein n=1 Tax=Coilia grayii TaxID=363190 RepID=A0ABD1IWH4_9TELE